MTLKRHTGTIKHLSSGFIGFPLRSPVSNKNKDFYVPLRSKSFKNLQEDTSSLPNEGKGLVEVVID